MTSDEWVKVLFRLRQDEDGYPPFSYESIWTIPKGGDLFAIDNIPFFTREATYGDTVYATEINNERWFTRIEVPSTNSLVRVIYPETTIEAWITAHLNELGCETEHFEQYSLIAVHIPGDVYLVEVQAFLHKAFTDGLLDYEEAIIRQ